MSHFSRRNLFRHSFESALFGTLLLNSPRLMAQANGKKRLILFYQSDGVPPGFWPQTPGNVFPFSRSLRSLEEIKENVLIYRGIMGSGESSLHDRPSLNAFTASNSKTSDTPNHPSIDTLFASQLADSRLKNVGRIYLNKGVTTKYTNHCFFDIGGQLPGRLKPSLELVEQFLGQIDLAIDTSDPGMEKKLAAYNQIFAKKNAEAERMMKS